MFTRLAGVWTQQGTKLVPLGAAGAAQLGSSVALSDDGNTAVVGGPADNSGNGATWVFTRTGAIWTQQGSKLIASDAAAGSQQGFAVATSGDGNTVLVGGPAPYPNPGAAWLYTRTGGVWTRQGSKLTRTSGISGYGYSVALSADGSTALVGSPPLDFGNSEVYCGRLPDGSARQS